MSFNNRQNFESINLKISEEIPSCSSLNNFLYRKTVIMDKNGLPIVSKTTPFLLINNKIVYTHGSLVELNIVSQQTDVSSKSFPHLVGSLAEKSPNNRYNPLLEIEKMTKVYKYPKWYKRTKQQTKILKEKKRQIATQSKVLTETKKDKGKGKGKSNVQKK